MYLVQYLCFNDGSLNPNRSFLPLRPVFGSEIHGFNLSSSYFANCVDFANISYR